MISGRTLSSRATAAVIACGMYGTGVYHAGNCTSGSFTGSSGISYAVRNCGRVTFTSTHDITHTSVFSPCGMCAESGLPPPFGRK